MGWAPVALEELLTPVSRGEAVDPSKQYRMLGVRLEGQGPFLRETVGGGSTAARKLNRVQAGDFIYSRLFAWRGAFGLVPPELGGSFVSGEFPTFVPKDDRLDLEFLRYWFRLPRVLARVLEDCTGSTPLTRNRFREEFFLKLEVPLPPRPVQRRVVERIERVRTLIGETNDLRKRSDDELSRVLSSAYHRLVDGASHKPMAEVAPITRRPVAVDLNGSYPELGIRSFGRGAFHKPALSGLEVGTKRLYRIEPGDLIFSNVFAWEGAIAVAGDQDRGRFGSHRFITCVPTAGVATAEFLLFHFLTPAGLVQIGEASPGGAGRNRTLGLTALEKLAVPTPGFGAQKWFGRLLHAAGEFDNLSAESRTLTDALLPSLLDRAFKGTL